MLKELLEGFIIVIFRAFIKGLDIGLETFIIFVFVCLILYLIYKIRKNKKSIPK